MAKRYQNMDRDRDDYSRAPRSGRVQGSLEYFDFDELADLTDLEDDIPAEPPKKVKKNTTASANATRQENAASPQNLILDEVDITGDEIDTQEEYSDISFEDLSEENSVHANNAEEASKEDEIFSEDDDDITFMEAPDALDEEHPRPSENGAGSRGNRDENVRNRRPDRESNRKNRSNRDDNRIARSQQGDGRNRRPDRDDNRNIRNDRNDSRRNRRRPEWEDEQPNKGLHLGVHLILLIAIIAILIVAGVRFYNWNRGTLIQINTGSGNNYDVEVSDSMVLMSASKLEGVEDDGVTTILALGNAPFSDETGENGLAGQIEALSDATVINASFPNSQVACLNATYDTSDLANMDDIFNLFYVSYAISIGDFTSLETVASVHTEDPQYQAAIDALKATDFSKVDIIAIMYDAVDYENQSSMQNEENLDDLTTYVNAMRYSFQLIQDAYPHIRVVFMSPTYMLHMTEDGQLQDSRTTNLGNGTLNQYWQYAYDTCGSASVSFLDNYYGSVNDSNYEQYLSDNIHLNDAGRTKIADHFVYKVINGTYAEYDVSSLAIATE